MRSARDIRPLVLCVTETAAIAAVGAAVGAGLLATAVAAAAWIVAAIIFGLSDRRWWARPRSLYRAAAKTWATASLASWLAAFLSPLAVTPKAMLLLPLAGLAVAVAMRTIWRAVAVHRRRPVLVVDVAGEDRLAAWLAYYWPEWEIVGLVDGRDAAAAAREAAGRGAAVAYYLNGQGAPSPGGLEALPLDDLLQRVSGRVFLEHTDGVRSRCSGARVALKRVMDLCVAAGGLALLAPLMALLAALIKLESQGPAIYRQRRLGRGLRPFEMLKFRSMINEAEQETGPVWAQANDPRCTVVGRVLRPLHLDELPQLVNVVRGEMSLVGPRPERPELADELLRTMPVYRKRLEVRPGITGWAQINQGYDREMDDVRRKLEYDLYYVKHCGPLFDTAILLRTIDAVIFGKPRRPARPDLP